MVNSYPPDDEGNLMKLELLLIIPAVFAAVVGGHGRSQSSLVKVSFRERLGPLNIDHMALGQGGLSDVPMWDDRIPEIRALNPRLIRLFVQEFFDLLPAKNKYHFDSLDRCVDAILQTGA